MKKIDKDESIKNTKNKLNIKYYDKIDDKKYKIRIKNAKLNIETKDSNKDKDLKEIFKNIENFKENYNEKIRDEIVKSIYNKAEDIAGNSVKKNREKFLSQQKIDDIVTSKITGIPIMLLLLAGVLWITIEGANVSSELLAKMLFFIEDKLTQFFNYINAPSWLHGILVLGIYRTLAWVISVMLPPMAIFFPIFTLLEDAGYLPRIAFNLDHAFKKACAHGKQALTMCMGFGCNAAGVIACRIIESPRERLIAILTNNFVPCNGRFPTLIALSMIFVGLKFEGSGGSSFIATLMIVLLVLIGIGITLLVSYILSKTLLKGVPSSFTLELPPYRKPQIGRVIYTSIIDRTIFVLMRAVVVAAPAGAIIYILGNITVGDSTILVQVANALDPFSKAIGLDGFILLAFILGLPANEIVLPILIMSYLSKGAMIDFESLEQLRNILISNGWTYLTLLNTMLFSLLHFPCGTTIWTIKKETGSIKWTIFSVIMPTVIAIAVCFLTTQVYNLIV
ncbi:ferrous iron transporter B [Clostridium botulinum]|uniref:Ferrous iron transport protein B n=1 Tax=Clostridium botulinum (strain Okra / Type B1) TaxID=498213 RepID=B1IGK3_CLOBK|nr:nucleoside recognition domain-containing protein [Clostridium botulinum]ACA44832.1 ferrous iron transport protein B [Clostridium botulinum B1 str. Okra]MBD5561665.1 ferrous iron transporter B [Clostridium botulinum]MBD5565333.1 ferrous iron transporter B [Clostridium botulinum]MBD5570662.1 ferrous iron transporter B [Clostridium botulinum]MBD5574817.1 ferrous iron transporter B [Clostridium botulinum]